MAYEDHGNCVHDVDRSVGQYLPFNTAHDLALSDPILSRIVEATIIDGIVVALGQQVLIAGLTAMSDAHQGELPSANLVWLALRGLPVVHAKYTMHNWNFAVFNLEYADIIDNNRLVAH